jgi:hypothetical protein
MAKVTFRLLPNHIIGAKSKMAKGKIYTAGKKPKPAYASAAITTPSAGYSWAKKSKTNPALSYTNKGKTILTPKPTPKATARYIAGLEATGRGGLRTSNMQAPAMKVSSIVGRFGATKPVIKTTPAKAAVAVVKSVKKVAR